MCHFTKRQRNAISRRTCQHWIDTREELSTSYTWLIRHLLVLAHNCLVFKRMDKDGNVGADWDDNQMVSYLTSNDKRCTCKKSKRTSCKCARSTQPCTIRCACQWRRKRGGRGGHGRPTFYPGVHIYFSDNYNWQTGLQVPLLPRARMRSKG